MNITAMILTFNEAPNIRRTLEKLTWVDEVLVIDSGSTDETLAILQDFPRVRVVNRAFDSFASQCNFGLQQVRTEWTLSVDADYVLTDQLVMELCQMHDTHSVAGYKAGFMYCIFGRPLRASLYPPRTVLYRKSLATYHDDGHGHKVSVSGSVKMLVGEIQHDDRKPLTRWFSSQDKYAKLEAEKLFSLPPGGLSVPDRIRRTVILGPVVVFFYTLLLRGAILDGWAGWFYTFQRTVAEVMLSLYLLERRLCPAQAPSSP